MENKLFKSEKEFNRMALSDRIALIRELNAYYDLVKLNILIKCTCNDTNTLLQYIEDFVEVNADWVDTDNKIQDGTDLNEQLLVLYKYYAYGFASELLSKMAIDEPAKV